MPMGFGLQDMASLGQANGQGAPQYVVGSPKQNPVLRPLRQNLHDSEIWPSAVAVNRRELFTNRRTFATGAAKNEFFTNMPGDGQLGTPLEFDLIGFNFTLDYGVDVVNFNAFYGANDAGGGVFKWVFGQQTVWLNTQLRQIPSGMGPAGMTTENLLSELSNGWPTVNNFYNFTNQARQARKIFSNETFRNLIEHPANFTAAGGANVYGTTIMLGMLYASL